MQRRGEVGRGKMGADDGEGVRETKKVGIKVDSERGGASECGSKEGQGLRHRGQARQVRVQPTDKETQRGRQCVSQSSLLLAVSEREVWRGCSIGWPGDWMPLPPESYSQSLAQACRVALNSLTQ